MRRNLLLSLISALAKVLGGIVLLSVLARIFTLGQFGDFTYSLALSTILSLLVDYGYNLKIMKEVSSGKSVEKVASNAFFGKLILLSIAILFVFLSNSLLNNSVEILWASLFLFIALSAFSFTNISLSVFKGKEEYLKDTKIVVIDNIMTGALVFLVAIITKSIVWASASFALAKSIAFLISFRIYQKEHSIHVPKLKSLKTDLFETLPYGIHFWVGNLYLNIDTVIMKPMVSAEEVGIYQAGIRIIIGAGILLTIINSVFLPALTRIIVDKRGSFEEGVKELNVFTIKYAVLITVLLILFGKWIVLLLYGSKFNDLISYFWLFAIIIGIRILGVTYGILLTISNKQRIRAIAGSLSIVIIVISDLFLIPIYGYMTAGFVLLAAHVFINAFYLISVYLEHKSLFIPELRSILTARLLP